MRLKKNPSSTVYTSNRTKVFQSDRTHFIKGKIIKLILFQQHLQTNNAHYKMLVLLKGRILFFMSLLFCVDTGGLKNYWSLMKTILGDKKLMPALMDLFKTYQHIDKMLFIIVAHDILMLPGIRCYHNVFFNVLTDNTISNMLKTSIDYNGTLALCVIFVLTSQQYCWINIFDQLSEKISE